MNMLITVRNFIIGTTCLFITGTHVRAQTAALRNKIEQYLQGKNAVVGVAIEGVEHGDTLSLNGNTHLPMQSVFKFHIALAVLNEVDKGRFSLQQKIHIAKTDLAGGGYSPIREQYPNGNIDLRLDTILAYTVSRSDNTGCDLLLKLLGGPSVVNNYLHQIGIKDIAIVASEGEMAKDWEVQFRNWTTARAANTLLLKLYHKKILSATSNQFMMQLLIKTSTGKDRIKGLLPPETQVAHKTGTSATYKGITAATNDIGIVRLPNQQHFCISIFVSNSKETDATNAAIIADITKLTWDYFNR
jgi:beta-lactamase class A